MWDSSRVERRGVRERLAVMAPGIRRCMYCGDNLGTDIDHFEPISRAPLSTFVWLNHLLACGHCNNKKRDSYPCDPSGGRLIIDPTRDEPSDHLRLILATGKYEALTVTGETTIEIFGLNRPDLVNGRNRAFSTRRILLHNIARLIDDGRLNEALRYAKLLTEEPLASVLYAMLGVLETTGAATILGNDLVAILSIPEIKNIVRNSWQSP